MLIRGLEGEIQEHAFDITEEKGIITDGPVIHRREGVRPDMGIKVSNESGIKKIPSENVTRPEPIMPRLELRINDDIPLLIF